jgi:hypothetical protein
MPPKPYPPSRPGTRGPVRLLVLALAASLLSLVAPSPAQASAWTTFRGAFTCGGKPVVGARVELWTWWSTGLPKVWPNARPVAVQRSNADGAWGWRVSQEDETNLFVRIVLVGEHSRVGPWGVPWNTFYDTAWNQNDVPLQDYGRLRLPGQQCELWDGLRRAAIVHRADLGEPPRFGLAVAHYAAPTAGVPFTAYDSIWWPQGHDATGRTPAHEFAHAVRHTFDGGRAHFGADVVRHSYLQHHDVSSCRPTNAGFAFNEGWAAWWSGVDVDACPGRDNWAVERNVVAGLRWLDRRCDTSRPELTRILRANPGRIHSFPELARRVQCRLEVDRRVVPGRPVVQPVRPAVRAGRVFLSSVRRQLAELRAERARAVAALTLPLPCAQRPCLAEYERAVAVGLVDARIAGARATLETFDRVDDRRHVTRLLSRPLTAWTRHWDRQQRRALATTRRTAAAAIDTALAALRRTGDDDALRARVAETLTALRDGVRSGAPDALAATSWQAVGEPTRIGELLTPTPVLDPITGLEVVQPVLTVDDCPPGQEVVWRSQDVAGADLPTPVTGSLAGAPAGSPVQLTYEHAGAEGTTRLEAVVPTDAAGAFAHTLPPGDWEAGFGRSWTIRVAYAGSMSHWPAAAGPCLRRVPNP